MSPIRRSRVLSRPRGESMSGESGRGRVARINDADIYFEVRGEGPPLFLLHGFTGAGSDWAHVFDLDALSARRCVVIPDLRGHGRSTNPRATITHRQCAMDVLALAEELGVSSFSAVGLSMGANVLLHISSREPERVGAQILVSATPHFPSEARKIMRGIAEAPRSDDEWRVMRERHVHGDEQIQALWKQMAVFADSHDDLAFTPPLLARITARTLLVAGDRDPLYPLPETTFELYRGIRGAHLFTVPSGGHGPIFGEWRETFLRAALGFLGPETEIPTVFA